MIRKCQTAACSASPPGDQRAALLTEGEALRWPDALSCLELKSAAAPGSLAGLLCDLVEEMRQQFEHFRRLRIEAEGRMAPKAEKPRGEASEEASAEAAAKLARADVKAAGEAMSLIVRTLEKVDGLQRQIARDREEEAERQHEAGGYEQARAMLLALIEARIGEQAGAAAAPHAA